MDSSKSEVAREFLPLLRVYKDGRVERLLGTEVVPPSTDTRTGVISKDVVIVPEIGVSARLYLPKITSNHQKLPVLVYFHGGGFAIESAFSPLYHPYLNSLVSEANIVAVSVEYRLAPEHPVPIAYEDSWAALQWVASHSKGDGPEAWLNDHADFQRVFISGDSAGGNITHHVAMRAGETALHGGVKLSGVILVQPYFWGEKKIGSESTNLTQVAEELWLFVCPSAADNDDPRLNPFADAAPSLAGLGCRRVLVFVAEKDLLRDRGWLYYEMLSKSGWGGVVEIDETEGEDHVFHLFNPNCDKAGKMMKRLVSFMNQE